MSRDARTAAHIYREQAVESASPARIVRLLLERALRGIDRAAAADANDPRSVFVAELQRAQDIVLELRLAIEPATAPEIASVTDALYEFVHDQVHRAITQRSSEPARAARPVLAILHETWCRIEQTT